MVIAETARNGELNVTPLVDVVLVLLIIFMVVTPVLRAGIEATVPPRAPAGERPSPADLLVVSLEADGSLYLNREPVPPGTFAARLGQALQGRSGRPTLVSVAGSLPYHKAVAFMELCRRAGATNLALVVDELTVR